MSQHFCISIRFLQPWYHGLRTRTGNEPEWPPSPLRLFQALVNAFASSVRIDDKLSIMDSEALQWLERQTAPLIVATTAVSLVGYCLSVPNNALDVVAKAWSRGNESNSGDANPATHRTMKTVLPTYLLDGDAVHYLWPLGEAPDGATLDHVSALAAIVGNIVALGWGMDMTIGHGTLLSQAQADALPGERWYPGSGASNPAGLRVPVFGTLEDLHKRHQQFLTRLEGGIFTPLQPVSVFDKIAYRRATDPNPRPFVAFSLMKPNHSGFRPFDVIRKGLTVAGMMRYAAKSAAEKTGWSNKKIDGFVMGHGESREEAVHISVGNERFAYLPLPSIEARGDGKIHVGSIRRVICCTFIDRYRSELDWAAKNLSGYDLLNEDNKQRIASLAPVPYQDTVVKRYTSASSVWTSVTPVILPGYDDPRKFRKRIKNGVSAEEQKRLLSIIDIRIEKLLRQAIVQAGYPNVLAEYAQLDWRHSGFLAGVDLASRYGVPDHLKHFPRLHVLIRWRNEKGEAIKIPGPICLGGGRFLGIGLLVATTE